MNTKTTKTTAAKPRGTATASKPTKPARGAKAAGTASAANATRRRWGSSQNAAPDEARARIVLAARACYMRQSVSGTTMADIAAEAKVVRATLYRHFASREAVMLAVFRDESREFLEQFRKDKGEPERFCDFFRNYLVYTVRKAPGTRMHEDLFSDNSALWVSRNFIADPESVGIATNFFRESFRVAQRVGEIRKDIELPELIEYAARVLMSFMLLPETRKRTEAQLGQYFDKYLIGALRPPVKETGDV